MNIDIFQWIGFLGMVCVVYAYFLLHSDKSEKDDWVYLWLNFLGAIFLTISLIVHFNLGSFLIEIFWIGITLYGIYKKRYKNETPTE